ncbi:MotA/TolQ/ExbB proton channel family protein [Salinisphaera aquimarina]|uniref:MotA/TolQ/ExbB proton channel family protein n=1 Tax=Salinisphaera aquimarina TaxID=2094031 RepID=A0ABV7EPA2_9GAMM
MALSLTRFKTGRPNAASYHVLQQWLIITGVLVFALWVAQQYNVVTTLIEGDSTRVSLLIALIFVVTWCYCGVRSAWLSREASLFDAIVAGVDRGERLDLHDEAHIALGSTGQPDSAAGAYLSSLMHFHAHRGAEPPDTLVDVLGEQLAGAHELGWFICGLLIKLGLLGTVIGFIVMLATVDSTQSFDVAAIQQLLVGMSQGMRVALYTTLVGLATSMVLSLHYLLLDRAADRLQSRIVIFAQRQRLG